MLKVGDLVRLKEERNPRMNPPRGTLGVICHVEPNYDDDYSVDQVIRVYWAHDLNKRGGSKLCYWNTSVELVRSVDDV